MMTFKKCVNFVEEPCEKHLGSCSVSMLKLVKYIDIVFENCEYVRIPVSFLGVFYIGRISTKIRRIASNAIEEQKIAKKVFIELFAEVDVSFLSSSV